jgi:hypothetical protein
MKRAIYLIGILILVMVAGCDRDTMIKKMTPPEDEAIARGAIDLLRQKEFEQIEKDIDPSLRNAGLHDNLVKMNALLPAEDPETIKVVGVQITQSQDSRMTIITYEYAYPGKWLLINVAVQKKGGSSTIVGFNINQLPDSLENLNRFTLVDLSGLQYLVLALAIFLPLFSLYTLVLCIRSKLGKRKWLWIIFILLGFGTFSLNWTTGETSFQILSVQILSAAANAAPYGPWTISISLPLGAILFLLLRGRIGKPTEASPAPGPG